ncbi:Acetyl-CoA carboxylase [Phytophthora citrophthora]|uniref:Acetyl-CoA carboxylase n=1 Tax=Phytophthora citrophthora TaxID=4793 RepID=A0AAD9LBD2_9STRA|nr:Acetyl-CoA carboxylase [Phytophthora citrophthora]
MKSIMHAVDRLPICGVDEIERLVNFCPKDKRKSPVFVYIPPFAELRGGAWAVVDPNINEGTMEIRGGVLKPAGLIEIKYRMKQLLQTMHRLTGRLDKLKQLTGRLAELPPETEGSKIKTCVSGKKGSR